MKFFLIENKGPGSNLVLSGRDEYDNYIVGQDEMVYEAQFQKGDIVEDRHANKFEVQSYWWNNMVDKFYVGLMDLDHGKSSFFADDANYMLHTSISGDTTNTTPTEKTLNVPVSCSHDNPDCNIVESYTGCGGSKGTKFQYCRTHKEEVQKKKTTKPQHSQGFWF